MNVFVGLLVNVLLVNPEKAIKLAVNDQARQIMGGKKYVTRYYDFIIKHCLYLLSHIKQFCRCQHIKVLKGLS